MSPYPIEETRWPTTEEAAGSPLFRPIRVGAFQAVTRTWVPAMVPWRASDEGFVTPEALDWYGRFADGRPGVLVVEATGIRDVPSGPLLRIGHDRFLPGLRELVGVVRERSQGETRLLIQVIDFLAIKRRPPREKFLGRFLALTARHRSALAERGLVAEGAPEDALREALRGLTDEDLRDVLTDREWEDLRQGYRERVTDTHLPHVAELPRVLPDLFADAARRSREAGFDGVELHYAHAYTMASFLSRKNDRSDGYGGSPDERVRLPLEVYSRVRERVGDDFTVGCRYLTDEIVDGGSRVEDAVHYGARFAQAGMDFLSLSRGGKFDDAKEPRVGEAAYPYTGESGHECMPTVRIDTPGPFGRNLPQVRAVREHVRSLGLTTPIVGAGGINTFELADAALRRGDCDIVAAARQSLADPDWFRKTALGRGAEVRRCKYTNYCEGLDQRHKQVTCQLWDRELDPPDPGREPGAPPARSSDGKRRLLPPAWAE